MKVTFLILTMTTILTSHVYAQTKQFYQCEPEPKHGEHAAKATLIITSHTIGQYLLNIRLTHRNLPNGLIGKGQIFSDVYNVYEGRGTMGQFGHIFTISTIRNSTSFNFRISGNIPSVPVGNYSGGYDFICRPSRSL